MDTLIEMTAVILGLLIRFGMPIVLTFSLALFLRWLDKRWQAEAEAMATTKIEQAKELFAYKKPCWEIHNCPPKMRNACRAYAQPETPCWELFRVNGRLKPACHTCKVLPPAIA
ncbi:MAG: hypothetical protein GY803_28105 [Chloroflexi bacterium]|nr:hypothetical protein [Chloroflexota bacterium]